MKAYTNGLMAIKNEPNTRLLSTPLYQFHNVTYRLS